MNKYFIERFLVIALLSILAFSANGQSSDTVADKSKTGKGVVLKTPDKFMRAPLAGFKGMLMLNPDAAAAIVVSYPDDKESLEELTKRLVQAVPGFFGDIKNTPTEWSSKPIEIHAGDIPNSGFLLTGKNGDRMLQLATFQREVNGLTFVYGYFAMRSPKDKDGDVKKYWMDDNGKGVKPFEAFWKSIS
jgi:hypothetical protein